jgi:hypothetical protein
LDINIAVFTVRPSAKNPAETANAIVLNVNQEIQKDARAILHNAQRRWPFGCRYVLPPPVALALERVFGEPVGGVIVIERSLYARVHLGMCATTRPNRILLAIDGQQFVSNADLVLHEYFHVVRQWGSGRLTRWRYLVESMRCGYWDNPFERDAREFAVEAVERYRRYLAESSSETRRGELT